MLSAISATLFAILFAMMAYADVPPWPSPPATDAALFCTGAAFCCADRAAGALAAAGFRTGARGVAGFFGTPFNCPP